MLHITYDLLSQEDFNILQNICADFDKLKIDEINTKEKSNFYNRFFVKEGVLKTYYDRLDEFLKLNIDQNKYNVLNLPKPNSWVNKVVPETNKNDTFHRDMSFLTAVTYLNDDFTDGEFAYKDINNDVILINPQINKTLIMDETLLHRVSPVTNGNRFSLVTFFQFSPKEKKTLL